MPNDTTIAKATIYAGEAQLLRWSDGPRGKTITLLLNPDGLDHPFRSEKTGAEHGQRVQIACVRVSDSEQPQPSAAGAQRSAPENIPIKQARPFKDLPRSQQAALKCQDAEFQYWLGVAGDIAPELRPDEADKLLKSRLAILSKRDLDRWPEAGANWDALLTDYEVRGYKR